MDLKGKRIAVLGLAYKAETDDIRESPAISIVAKLLAEGAEIHAHDPTTPRLCLTSRSCLRTSTITTASSARSLGFNYSGTGRYVIERILEYGDDQSITWLRRNVTPKDIAEVVKSSRVISPNTAALWALILDISNEEITCLSILSTKQHYAS